MIFFLCWLLINVISWLDCTASICNNYPCGQTMRFNVVPVRCTQFMQQPFHECTTQKPLNTNSPYRIDIGSGWLKSAWIRSVFGANKKQHAFLCSNALCALQRYSNRGTISIRRRWMQCTRTKNTIYSHIEHHSISSFINKSSAILNAKAIDFDTPAWIVCCVRVLVRSAHTVQMESFERGILEQTNTRLARFLCT